MISLDTETTGLDTFHNAKPYFVTICDNKGKQTFYEWEVSPETRNPIVPIKDVVEIKRQLRLCDAQNVLVGQNFKFDTLSLSTIGISEELIPWQHVRDTLIAAHLLASNQPHSLDALALQYLGQDIQPLEKVLEEAVQTARRWARSHRPHWKIAKEDLLDENGKQMMPSAKEKTWKYDGWLPRLVAQERAKEGESDFKIRKLGNHPWYTVLRDYANMDSAVTVAVWQVTEKELKKRGLWEIYLERMKLPPILVGMEKRGITYIASHSQKLREQYSEQAEELRQICINLADGEVEKLPVNGRSNALNKVVFEKFGIKSSKVTATGAPSMDKYVLEEWLLTLDHHSKPYLFIKSLRDYRRRQTAISYIESYEKFALPLYLDGCEGPDYEIGGEGIYKVLHPSSNPTGTNTLRFSFANPNSTQVSKQELEADTGEEGSHSARWMFGPAPGREWWKGDYENLELRIPAFGSGEKALLEVFLHPENPPYYGSYHLVVFGLLWPELFRKYGAKCKELPQYQWTKNFDFLVVYGGGEKLGDQTAHQKGAWQKMRHGFPAITAYGDRMVAFAEKNGYVETMPDRMVNPKHGYPLMCTRTEYGRVLPTVPLNYHVQGTAMWCTCKAMVRCEEKLKQWRKEGFDAWMVLQVHDELVFDFPKGKVVSGAKWEPENLWRARELQKLMEKSGEDIGVPLKISLTYCPETWEKGEVF